MRLKWFIALAVLAGSTAGAQDFDQTLSPSASPAIEERISLSGAENVRVLRANVLEVAAALPAGAVIVLPPNAVPVNHDYREASGAVRRSSTGFFAAARLVSVPAAHEKDFPASRLAELNGMTGGLYITAAVANDAPIGPEIPPKVPVATPGDDFLLNYSLEGKPRYTFSSTFRKRFGDRLNLAVDRARLPEAERRKWSAIGAELVRATDRQRATSSEMLFIDPALALDYAIQYEERRLVQPRGAWTIAVRATAPRNGFGNVPCAEFVSELVRQAYQRAGYDVRDDFNVTRGNELHWKYSSAVVNLTTALFKAGWIPWDSAEFIPPVGALIMNERATTPGHAYVSAGDAGRLIVDNGSPRGRDLRVTSDRIIKMMYQTGVFFLPPGELPRRW